MKTEIDINLTPEQIASAFWSFDDSQQAMFFKHLHKITQGRNAEMQWLAMTDRIKEDKDAKSCFLSFTCFAYDYWPQKITL